MNGKKKVSSISLHLIGTPLPDVDLNKSLENLTRRERREVEEATSWENRGVYDEKGRKRFHGAFTGGWSAGYYNTVGSKEGWTPKTYVSSRSNRNPVPIDNSLESIMDDEDRNSLISQKYSRLKVQNDFSSNFDLEQQHEAVRDNWRVTSVIPGTIPDIFLPMKMTIGLKLLNRVLAKRAIPHNSSLYKDTYLHQEKKKDTHGLGYDDYNNKNSKANIDTSNSLLEPYLRPTYIPSIQETNSGSGKLFLSTKGRKSSCQDEWDQFSGDFFIDKMEDHNDSNSYKTDFLHNSIDLKYNNESIRDSNNNNKTKQNERFIGFLRSKNSFSPIESFPLPNVPSNFNPNHKIDSSILNMVNFDNLLDASKRGILLGEVSELRYENHRINEKDNNMENKSRNCVNYDNNNNNNNNNNNLRYLEVTQKNLDSKPTPNSNLSLIKRFESGNEYSKGESSDRSSKSLCYPSDPAKQLRYEKWLQVFSGQISTPLEWNDGLTPTERRKEHLEFLKSGNQIQSIFKPLSESLAEKFSSSGTLFSEQSIQEQKNRELNQNQDQLESQTTKVVRIIEEWWPNSLLVKRMGITNAVRSMKFEPPQKIMSSYHKRNNNDNTNNNNNDQNLSTQESNEKIEAQGIQHSLIYEQKRTQDENLEYDRAIDNLYENNFKKMLINELTENDSQSIKPPRPSIDLFKAIFEDENDVNEVDGNNASKSPTAIDADYSKPQEIQFDVMKNIKIPKVEVEAEEEEDGIWNYKPRIKNVKNILKRKELQVELENMESISCKKIRKVSSKPINNDFLEDVKMDKNEQDQENNFKQVKGLDEDSTYRISSKNESGGVEYLSSKIEKGNISEIPAEKIDQYKSSHSLNSYNLFETIFGGDIDNEGMEQSINTNKNSINKMESEKIENHIKLETNQKHAGIDKNNLNTGMSKSESNTINQSIDHINNNNNNNNNNNTISINKDILEDPKIDNFSTFSVNPPSSLGMIVRENHDELSDSLSSKKEKLKKSSHKHHKSHKNSSKGHSSSERRRHSSHKNHHSSSSKSHKYSSHKNHHSSSSHSHSHSHRSSSKKY